VTPHQKPKTIRLKGKALQKLKLQAYERDCGCCVVCGVWLPLLDYEGQFNIYTCAHMAHKKSKGSGGSDNLDNVEIKCFHCHNILEHTKGIK
jgi:5-methylcytosine-specific restriction endonuclease McrA